MALAARRQGRAHGRRRVRQAPSCTGRRARRCCSTACPPTRAVLDEPPRQRHRGARPASRSLRLQRPRAGRRHGGSRARPLRHAVPPRGRAHAARQDVLTHFLYDVCDCRRPGRRPRSSRSRCSASATRSATSKAICGLSGGVDSSVAAVLVHKAIGDQLTCVFVDQGMMRKNEARAGRRDLRRALRHPARSHVDAEERFLDKLAGVTDPERKRKIIGEEFIRVSRKRRASSTRRPLPRAGHALPRRHRDRHAPGGQDQEPPQRRRPARGDGLRAGRAAARAVQGRGARGRRGARPARARSSGASRSPGRASPCASSARSRASASTSCARRRHRAGGDQAGRASTASSGSASRSCRRSARWACRATSAPTRTRSSSARSRATTR